MKHILYMFCLAIVLTGLLIVAADTPLSAAPGDPRVRMETSLGDIVIELYPQAAPKTVENFLTYTRGGYFDGTIFHRTIKGFMIQGGGFTPDMNKKGRTMPPIQNEAANKMENKRYTIAMARTNDPHSATSQFFINTVDNSRLNYTESTRRGYGYCVFGKVVEGTGVVDAIENQPTETKGHYQNVPKTPVLIKKAVVVE